MKNPFRRFRTKAEKVPEEPQPVPDSLPEEEPQKAGPQPEPEKNEPEDPFVEWCRSRVRGGIERRERNDIFEAYSVFGTDEGKPFVRYYHRYPEHERTFDLSYSRALTLDEFNKRLLSELDKGDLDLSAYNDCIEKARAITAAPAFEEPPYAGFSAEETELLRDFCEAMDTLTDKEYRSENGVFHCACRGVVGDDRLLLRFRKPLLHDALYADVAGVDRKPVEGYDIENIWMMGVHNRLRERCGKCGITLLTSVWNLQHESVYLMITKHFPGVEGTLMLAVADEDAQRRFGFYSLDFSKK